MRDEGQLHVARPDADFLIESLDQETLVYDSRTAQAHCLDARATTIWRLCDGERSMRAIAEACAAAGLPCTLVDVAQTVDQLARMGLVVRATAPTRPSRTAGATDRSRRRFVRKALVASAVVAASPVIFSIVAPSVAEAASTKCGQSAQPCTGTGQGTCCAAHVCLGGLCRP